jgi:glycerol transport system permease protein
MSDRRFLLILPALIVLGFNSFFPILIVLNYSFQKPFATIPKFVEFGNYIQVLHSSAWWSAFRRNIFFTCAVLAIELPLGLILALIIRERGKFAAFVSAVIVLPSLIPFVSIGIVWRLLVMTRGPIPLFFKWFGIDYSLMTPDSAFWTFVVMDVWHWVSLVFLLLSAGLITIPDVYYTAAKVDGSTKWQTFRYITLPGIKHPLILVGLLRIIDSFKIYDENVILTGGGPGRTTEFLSLFLVKKGLREWAGGFASAASLIYLLQAVFICFLLIMIVTKGRGMLER